MKSNVWYLLSVSPPTTQREICALCSALLCSVSLLSLPPHLSGLSTPFTKPNSSLCLALSQALPPSLSFPSSSSSQRFINKFINPDKQKRKKVTETLPFFLFLFLFSTTCNANGCHFLNFSSHLISSHPISSHPRELRKVRKREGDKLTTDKTTEIDTLYR